MCGGSYVGRGMRHGMWRHTGGRTFLGRCVEGSENESCRGRAE